MLWLCTENCLHAVGATVNMMAKSCGWSGFVEPYACWLWLVEVGEAGGCVFVCRMVSRDIVRVVDWWPDRLLWEVRRSATIRSCVALRSPAARQWRWICFLSATSNASVCGWCFRRLFLLCHRRLPQITILTRMLLVSQTCTKTVLSAYHFQWHNSGTNSWTSTSNSQTCCTVDLCELFSTLARNTLTYLLLSFTCRHKI